MKQTKPVDERVWTLPFVTICLGYLLCTAAQQSFNATTALFIDSFGGSASAAGAAVTIFSLSALAGRAVCGRILDTAGRRKVLMAGGIMYAVGALGHVFMPNVASILLLKVFAGFGYSLETTAQYTVAADVLPETRMGEGLGYFGVGLALSSSIGPQLGLIFARKGAFSSLHIILTVVVILSLVAGMIGRSKEPKVTPAAKGSVKQFLTGCFEKTALPTALVTLFIFMGVAMIFSFLTLFAERRGYATGGLFFVISAVAVLLTRLFSGRFQDRYGPTCLLVPCGAAGLLCFLILAFSSGEAMFLFCGLLYGTFFGLATPLLNSVSVQVAPKSRRGAAVATCQAALDLGIAAGGLVLGVIVDYLGFRAAFIASALFVLAGLISGMFFWRDIVPASKSAPSAPLPCQKSC